MATSDLLLATKAALSPSELDDAGALVAEARWNQIAADWRIFLELGRVYTAQAPTGRIVATTATLPFGGRFAWISMVLVTADFRRRGLATRLMRGAIDDLVAAGLVPVLDATPEGRAVYRALGFEDSWGFHRLVRREPRPAAATAPPPDGVTIRTIADAAWPALTTYDAAAFGADRGAMLARLRGRLPAAELIAERAGRIVGFLLGRDGRVAVQAGPLIAEDDEIARALLAHALDAIDAPVFVDLADAKAAVRAWLEARGFAAVRPLTRMLLARSQRYDDAARTFAVVGPEFG